MDNAKIEWIGGLRRLKESVIRHANHRLRGSQVLNVGCLLAMLMPITPSQAANSSKAHILIYPSTFLTRQVGSMYGDRIAGRHGYLFVPENRANPHSQTIMIGFWVLPSTAESPRSPIVYLMGGPGHANIDTWRTQDQFDTLRKLLTISDVILFDQRGSGSPSDSSPSLQCPKEFSFPLDQPWRNRSEVQLKFVEHIDSCAKFFTARGVDLRGYTFAESADDMEDLRIQLGYVKLNVWGYSAGSFLGRIFAERHPGSVEHLLVGGIMDNENPDSQPVIAYQSLSNGFTTPSG